MLFFELGTLCFDVAFEAVFRVLVGTVAGKSKYKDQSPKHRLTDE